MHSLDVTRNGFLRNGFAVVRDLLTETDVLEAAELIDPLMFGASPVQAATTVAGSHLERDHLVKAAPALRSSRVYRNRQSGAPGNLAF